MISVDIATDHIEVMRLFWAKEDVRKYLEGFVLEVGAEECRLFATDGHRAVVIRSSRAKQSDAEQTEVVRTIVPSSLFAGNAWKARGLYGVTLEIGDIVKGSENGARMLTLVSVAGRLTVPSLDFAPVDWRRVLPRDPVNGQAAQYDIRYLMDCLKAAEILRGKKKDSKPYILVGHNGHNAAAVIRLNEDATAIVLPLRKNAVGTEDGQPPRIPEWAFAPLWVANSAESGEKPAAEPVCDLV